MDGTTEESNEIDLKCLLKSHIMKYFGDIYSKRWKLEDTIWIADLVRCPRYAYFSATSPKKPIKTSPMLVGICIHSLFREYEKALKKYKIEKKIEYGLRNGWKLVGKPDLLDSENGLIIELRSFDPFYFNEKEIIERTRKQVNLYSYIIKVKENVEVKKFKILVLNISNGEISEHDFDLNEEEAKGLIELAEEVIKKGESGLLFEDKKLFKNEKECRFCEYRDDCSEKEEKRKRKKRIIS